MKNLDQEKILISAENIIRQKGLEKTTMTDIAKSLGVTHAALYKHYKNKNELLEQLALNWLHDTSKQLFNFTPKTSDPKKNLYDFLWLLTSSKKKHYQEDPQMFTLYTNYIENNPSLVKKHLKDLSMKINELTGENNGTAILTAFSYFHNPYFASRWNNDNHKELFNQVFSLINQY